MKTFRRLQLKTNKGRRETWRAEIFDEGKQRYRWLTLFPSIDQRFRDSSCAVPELRGAWKKASAGKVPSERQAVLRAQELYREIREKAGYADGELTLRGLAEIEKSHVGKRRRRKVTTMNSLRRVIDRFVEFMEDQYPAVPVCSSHRC